MKSNKNALGHGKNLETDMDLTEKQFSMKMELDAKTYSVK